MENSANIAVTLKNAGGGRRRRDRLLCLSAILCGEYRHQYESKRRQTENFHSVHDESLHSPNRRATLGCSLSIVNSSASHARCRNLRTSIPSRQSFPFSSLACYLRRLRGSSMSVNK